MAIAGALTFGLASRAMWQMVPRSPLLRKLDELPVPAGSQLIAVEAEADAVVPRGYAQLAPCRAQRNVEMAGVGHVALLHAQQSLSLVCRLLEAPVPDEPSPLEGRSLTRPGSGLTWDVHPAQGASMSLLRSTRTCVAGSRRATSGGE